MNEHRSSTSEGIWIGLCILLLLVMAGVGGFGYMQLRRANRMADAAQAAFRAALQRDLRSDHGYRVPQVEAEAISARADALSHQILEQQRRIGELEAENQKLRQQLKDGSE